MFTFGSPTGSLSSLSWGAGQYLYLRWSESDDSGSDATFGVDNFKLWTAAESAQNLTWNVTSGTWNTSTANWTGGSSNIFAAGDTVTFSGTGGGTVTLSGSLAPASMTVSATAGTYTFSGASASDKVSGATSIAKSGAGTAVFTSANDFSGGVNITGGVVSISGSDQLGNGTITVNGGQLTSTAGSALTLANALTVGGSGGTVNSGAQNLTVNGAATLGGVLSKSGNGTLILASPTVSAGAGFNVGAGTIQLGGTATSGVYSLATSSTLTGNLTIGGTQRLNVNAGGSIAGSGTLQFMTSGALLSQQSGFTGGTVSAPIALNSTGAAFTPGVYTTGSYTPGSFVSTIGATSGASGTAGTFTLNSVISGNADVNISNNSSTGGGRGLLILGGQSTYTGNTMIDANTPDGFSAVSANVQLGVSNALPTSTGLIYGTRSGAVAAVIDLNGFSQQVAFVGDGNQFVAGTKFLTITNLSSGTSTFTIGGSTNATFGGVLAGGSLKLVKQGSGSQTLSGSSTFGGGTTLNAGTLIAGNAAAFGTGAVVVNGGTLDLGSFAIGNAVSVNGGSLANAGSYSGTTTITGTVSLGSVPNSAVTVAAGGVLQGTPTVASLGGAGLVSPGSSPGIITAGTLDPSGGIDFALEFTGTAPDYGTAAASVNDVVRLTAGSPFLSSLTGANVVDVYLNVNSFAVNDSFQGGFFTTLSANDLLAALSGATFNFFGKATGGSVTFNGESYNPLTSFAGITGATVSTTAVTANFGGGNVTGSAMQFVIVPEPSTLALAGLGVALAGYAAWKRRRAA
jgi:autotransporter-associated beta strand protein